MIESDHHGKPPEESKTTCAKLNDLVTLERGHLNWFRYPTHNIGTYLGRGGVTRSPIEKHDVISWNR